MYLFTRHSMFVQTYTNFMILNVCYIYCNHELSLKLDREDGDAIFDNYSLIVHVLLMVGRLVEKVVIV